MRVRYLDLKTGLHGVESGVSEYELTEGNYSCDCNRVRCFPQGEERDTCTSERYIVIGVEPEEADQPFVAADVIRCANEEYYEKLRKKKPGGQPG